MFGHNRKNTATMTNKQYKNPVPLVLDLLFDLREIVDRQELDQLRTPAAIVLLAAVSNLVSAIASVRWVAPVLPGSTTNIYLISAVTAVLLPLAVWIGTAVAFYVIATLSFIDVDLRATVWLTGVGMIPYVLSSLLGTAATLFAITQISAPESVELVQARSSIIQSFTVVRFTNILYPIAVVWTGVNWIKMGSAAWDVSTKRAAKIVCGPLVLLLAIFITIKI